MAARVFFVCVIALALIFLDRKTDLLEPAKAFLLSAASPIYKASSLPEVLTDWTADQLITKDDLLVENARLESENIVLRAKVQKLASLTVENIRLRELLNSSSLLEQDVVVAEVVAVSPDPFLQYVMLDKGSNQGVYIGQAVVDAHGLFGQVIELAENSSRVLLITDQRHAVPAQVDRNGTRVIIEGNNDFNELRLLNVALTTDLVEGDVLSTSGLGGVFPVGYPVAKVVSVKHDPGQAFAEVLAKPFAHLERSRYVLLLFDRQ